MKFPLQKKLVSLLLICSLALTLTACQGRGSSSSSDSGESSSQSQSVSYEPSEPPEEILPDNAANAKALISENSDVVGWLQIPGTTIDDVVVWTNVNHETGQPDYNQYYERRDLNRNESFTGIYYADFRCTFDGTREGLAQNTVIYGHSMEDDPDGPIFSQLKKFQDEEFARSHPYISFSTTEEDMVWEVFAVFHAYTKNDRSNNFMYYNTPVFESAQAFSDIVSEATKRSLYTYDVPVSADDKIITLSTCVYSLTPEYPNPYRYAVMARLVDAGEELKEEASFQVNPSPKAA